MEAGQDNVKSTNIISKKTPVSLPSGDNGLDLLHVSLALD